MCLYSEILNVILVEISRITACQGIIDQIDRSPNSFAERAILDTLRGSKYNKEDYELINPIFGTYINGRAMRQSQIKLDKDVNLQSEMIEYIMSKCLDNFERSLILIDCAQVYIGSIWWDFPILESGYKTYLFFLLSNSK